MKCVSAGALALAVSACTTAQFYARPPSEVFHSPRAREDVAECLMNRLATPDYPFVREELGPVTRVSLAPALAFDIRDEGQGSVIEMRRATSITVGQKTARSCF